MRLALVVVFLSVLVVASLTVRRGRRGRGWQRDRLEGELMARTRTPWWWR